MVQFENVGVRYGTGPEVLSDITFGLPDGSFHFVTGPSGAGKSSLLKLMYLTLQPSRGLIKIFDRNAVEIDREELPVIRRQIGIVFQDFRLIDRLSTFDNVGLSPAIKKLVFLESDDDSLAPKSSIFTFASARLIVFSAPVISIVLLDIFVSLISLL